MASGELKQIKDYIVSVGYENIISCPTEKDREAFNGILYTRKIPNLSLILAALAS